jgi:hypothetical protein
MAEITIKDKKGNNLNISVIGFFRIPELEKEFVMYGLMDDDKNNETGHVLLGEVIREEDNIIIDGIDSEEKDLVVAYYNEVINQIGDEENE